MSPSYGWPNPKLEACPRLCSFKVLRLQSAPGAPLKVLNHQVHFLLQGCQQSFLQVFGRQHLRQLLQRLLGGRWTVWNANIFRQTQRATIANDQQIHSKRNKAAEKVCPRRVIQHGLENGSWMIFGWFWIIFGSYLAWFPILVAQKVCFLMVFCLPRCHSFAMLQSLQLFLHG